MKKRKHKNMKRKIVLQIDTGVVKTLAFGVIGLIVLVGGMNVAGAIIQTAPFNTQVNFPLTAAQPAITNTIALPSSGIVTAEFTISGMVCGSCVLRVTNALSRLDGILDKQVTVGSAIIKYDAGKVSVDQITAAIEAIGYRIAGVKPADSVAADAGITAPKPTGGCGCGG